MTGFPPFAETNDVSLSENHARLQKNLTYAIDLGMSPSAFSCLHQSALEPALGGKLTLAAYSRNGVESGD